MGRRTLAISLAVLIPALLLLMLLSFGAEKPPEKTEEFVSVVSIQASEPAEETAEPSNPERAEEPSTSPQPKPEEQLPPRPAEPLPPQAAEPKAAPTIPKPADQPPAPARIGVRPPGGQVYGPPNTGASAASRDTARVGTAPNGEPLYAAAWYREPSDAELRGFLSTASGPGWG